MPRTMCPGWNWNTVSAPNHSLHAKGKTYHDLFNLGKVIRGVGVQLHGSDDLKRNNLLWDDLRGIQKVKAKGFRLALVYDLDS